MADGENKEHNVEHKEHTEHKVEHKVVHHHTGETKIKKSTVWQIIALVLGVGLIISLAFNISGSGSSASSATDKDAAAKNAIDYINGNLLAPGTSAELVSVAEEGNLYKMKIKIGAQEFDSYVSLDGEMLYPSAVPLTANATKVASNTTQTQPPAQQPAVTLTKSDKPVVDVFIMSHCPYGTQIEKGIIPVAKLLGDKIDFNVRFVYYAMHGEKEVLEQLNQYCIQKEQTSKLIPYLECFLNDSNGARCLNETKIDAAKLSKCTKSADAEFSVIANLNNTSSWLSGRFPKFDIDKTLNEKYSVGGSPTLIINGAEASAGRDSASLLKAVCGAFNTAPAECSQNLSSASPSPGFGYNAAASSGSAGDCGA